jgi:preprotein translocase subunit SecY
MILREMVVYTKVRPGQDTANYLDDILSKITLPGAIFLSIFAVLPALVHGTFVQTEGSPIFSEELHY